MTSLSRARRSWWAALTVVALIAVACGSGGGAPQVKGGACLGAGGPAAVGKAAPDFTCERLEGGELALRALRGQVVLLNFWATWCGPCKVEMPIIQQVYDEYHERGFEVVGINFGEPPEDALDFVQRGGFSWPFVTDWDQGVAKRYNVLGLPSSFFLDRQGVVRQVHVGPFVSAGQLQQKVEGLLAPPSASTTGAGGAAIGASLP